jgi:type IV pilus assembly protein PilE
MMRQGMRQRGFTLIELMIVLVFLGIITTIAAQSFSGAKKDGERASILAEMSALNDAVGRYYQGNYSYTGASVSNVPIAEVRGGIKANSNYAVTLVIPDGQSYFLIAKPLSTGVMEGEGTYSIDHLGQRCYFPASDNANPATDGCPKKL